MFRLDLDIRANQSGYSGRRVINTADVAVTLLAGNEYRSTHERYAQVELKHLYASVLADRAAFGDLNADAPPAAWMSMALRLLKERITIEQLAQLVAERFEDGRKQGRHEAQAMFRAAIGLE